jgi:tetratricopeptide (TPR) repeat protein
MGNVILCEGKKATVPYVFAYGNVAIFTIEELCWYIYNNIEAVAEEINDFRIADFIAGELGLPERGAVIRGYIENKNSLKDLATAILCSCNYYTMKEIKGLLSEIDLLIKLGPMQRKKHTADTLMAAGDIQGATAEYIRIFEAAEPTDLPSREYGNVMHNVAAHEAINGAYLPAAAHFKAAYEYNSDTESYRQYLEALRMSGRTEFYDRESRKLAGMASNSSSNITHKLPMQADEHQTEGVYEFSIDYLCRKVKQLHIAKSTCSAQEYRQMLKEAIDLAKEQCRLSWGGN